MIALGAGGVTAAWFAVAILSRVIDHWLERVRLPSLQPAPHRIDNPVTARVEARLNLGEYFHVALRCGTERLWLAAPSNLVRQNGLETGCEVTVDLRSSGLLCWPHRG